MAITITNYRPYQKGALAAFFTVTLPSALLIHECKLFEKEGRRWIGLPSKPFKGKDGSTGYSPILEFSSREASESFRDAVLRAIDGMQKPATKFAPANSGVAKVQIPPDDSDIPF